MKEGGVAVESRNFASKLIYDHFSIFMPFFFEKGKDDTVYADNREDALAEIFKYYFFYV